MKRRLFPSLIFPCLLCFNFHHRASPGKDFSVLKSYQSAPFFFSTRLCREISLHTWLFRSLRLPLAWICATSMIISETLDLSLRRQFLSECCLFFFFPLSPSFSTSRELVINCVFGGDSSKGPHLLTFICHRPPPPVSPMMIPGNYSHGGGLEWWAAHN